MPLFVGALALLLLVLPLAPLAWWLARPARLAAIREAPGREVVAWWVAAAAPWVVGPLLVRLRGHLGFNADSPSELLIGIALLLAADVLLVAPPVAALVATLVWARGRRRAATRPSG